MVKMRGRTREKGFSMAELLIAICIIGIIAAIALPRFIEQKDRAILAATTANLDAMRVGLSQYAISSENNKYPDGPLTYRGFLATVPECNMPPLEPEAKIRISTFSYLSDGETYAINAISMDRSMTQFVATQAGIVYK